MRGGVEWRPVETLGSVASVWREPRTHRRVHAESATRGNSKCARSAARRAGERAGSATSASRIRRASPPRHPPARGAHEPSEPAERVASCVVATSSESPPVIGSQQAGRGRSVPSGLPDLPDRRLQRLSSSFSRVAPEEYRVPSFRPFLPWARRAKQARVYAFGRRAASPRAAIHHGATTGATCRAEMSGFASHSPSARAQRACRCGCSHALVPQEERRC